MSLLTLLVLKKKAQTLVWTYTALGMDKKAYTRYCTLYDEQFILVKIKHNNVSKYGIIPTYIHSLFNPVFTSVAVLPSVHLELVNVASFLHAHTTL